MIYSPSNSNSWGIPGIPHFQTDPNCPMSGRKMAWNRTWKTSGRQLSEQVVVSVAVDIEARHGPGFFGVGKNWENMVIDVGRYST